MRRTSLWLPPFLLIYLLTSCSLPGLPAGSANGADSRSTPGPLTLTPGAFQIVADAYMLPDKPGLYIMNADQSNRHRLRGGPSTPAWSPDGQQIVYSREDDSNYLHVMKADGSADHRLTDAIAGESPAWSPKGDQIAFSTLDTAQSQVFVMKTDGTGVKLVSFKGGMNPSWSPDGTRIVYGNLDGAGFTIVKSDGSDPQQITMPNSIWEPCWSPNGRQIAFDSWYGEIFVVDVDGRNLRQVRLEKGLSGPQWSKDGQWLLVTGKIGDDEQSQIYAMRADGREIAKLTDEKVVEYKHASWNR